MSFNLLVFADNSHPSLFRSYTDRILWKSTEGMKGLVTPTVYEPCPDFITSDHKPIRGAFTVKLNKR